MARRRGGIGQPWTHAPATWPDGPYDLTAAGYPHAAAAVDAAARVARNVRRRRRDADLSRRGLAIRAGLSEQTVGAVERGAVWPDLVTLAGLAAALGCDVRDLLDG